MATSDSVVFRSWPGTVGTLLPTLVFGVIGVGLFVDPASDWFGYAVGGYCVLVAGWGLRVALVPTVAMTDQELAVLTVARHRRHPWREVAGAEIDHWSMGGRAAIVFRLHDGRKIRPAILLTATGSRRILDNVVCEANRRIAAATDSE